MNPYAAQLGDRDPIAVVAASADRLRALLRDLQGDGSKPPRTETPRAPGKWSPRQIACHLADCDIMFSWRLRQTLAEAKFSMIQPFDQDRWAERYAAYTAEQALALFTSLRGWNCAWFARLSPSDWARAALHPQRGAVTVRDQVEHMAGHDLHHLAQLEAQLAMKFAA